MNHLVGKVFKCIKRYGPIKKGTVGICIEVIDSSKNNIGYFRLSLSTPVLGVYEIKVSKNAIENFHIDRY